MKFIQGTSREQLALFPASLEAVIGSDNEVRVIDLFVDSLNLGALGFKTDFVENGRPGYHPSDLLKLFIYGYLNCIRSSRALEKECTRNIELMWLLKQLSPDHNTIANFRKEYTLAIKSVFRSTVTIAEHFKLIGGTLLAGDGTKLRAQNSKKNNFNAKKIERHVVYIDNKIDEYTAALAQADGDDKTPLEKKIEKHHRHRKGYENLSKQLEESGEEQISTSDTESRQMIIRGQITEVAYNVQTTVDAEHCLPIDYDLTNTNDSKALGDMVERAAEIIGNTTFTALFDKGYHTASEIKRAQQLSIHTLVAIPEVASHAPDTAYDLKEFYYEEKEDYYRCPEGQILLTNEQWYTKTHRNTKTLVKHYKTPFCEGCSAKALCTRNQNGRLIERSEYAHFVDQNRRNIEQNKELYKRRQAIIEHVFGTLKRQWGFCHILTKKGKKAASGDVGFMFIAYNLKRLFSILGKNEFKTYLRQLVLEFLAYLNLINQIQFDLSPPEIQLQFLHFKNAPHKTGCY